MATPLISDFILYTTTPLTDTDYAFNWAEVVKYVSDGTFDFTVNSLTTTANITAAGTITGATFVGAFPAGGIIMWAGTIATIPTGWALCDGTNGTPDLKDRFILSVGAAENPGGTGGANTHTHTNDAHTHTVTAHTHTYSGTTSTTGYGAYCDDGGGAHLSTDTHTHTYSGTTSGGSSAASSAASANTMDTISNVPVYYKLAFIMKL